MVITTKIFNGTNCTSLHEHRLKDTQTDNIHLHRQHLHDTRLRAHVQDTMYYITLTNAQYFPFDTIYFYTSAAPYPFFFPYTKYYIHVYSDCSLCVLSSLIPRPRKLSSLVLTACALRLRDSVCSLIFIRRIATYFLSRGKS